MKKPTLRLRQVFEGPTHFKVVKPLGNPIKIAKKGLSPNLMSRLRKYSNGTPDEPVQPPTDEEIAIAEQMQQARLPAGTEFPPMAGEGLFGVPALPVEPSDSNLEVPQIVDVAERIEPISPRPRPKRPLQPEPVAAAPDADVIEPSVAKPRPRPRRPNSVETAVFVEEVVPSEPIAAEAEPAAPASKEPAPAEPSSFDKALSGLGYTRAQYDAFDPPMKLAANQAVRATIAAQAAADAEANAVEQETALLATEQAAQKEELQRLQKSADEARTIQKNILTDFDYLKNPTTYLGSMSTLGQIGTAISLAAGAFASGMTGMPNFAQKIYDNAIEQDLQAQKRRADSLYQRLVNAGSSVENAENMVRAQLKLVGAAEQTRRAAEIKLPQVKAKIQAEAAKQALDATNTMQRIARDQANEAREASLAPLRERELRTRVGEAEAQAELRPLKKEKLEAEVAIAKLTPEKIRKELKLHADKLELDREKAEQTRQDRLDAAKTKAEEDAIARELDIGQSTLELKSKERAPMIRSELAQREQALMAAIKLDALLRESGLEIFDPRSNRRGEAIAELATLVEIFPKIQGFQRAISVSAKTQLEKGLQDPTGFKAALKDIFLGRDPAVGVHAILEEGKRSYANQVKKHVRDSRDPRVELAIQSFFEDAEKEIAKYKTVTAADEEL